MKPKNFLNFSIALSAALLSACGTQPAAPIAHGWNDTTPRYSNTLTLERESIVVEDYKPVERQSLVHVVQHGESLWAISKRYNTDVASLRAANNLSNNILHKGQRLKVTSGTQQVAKSSSFTDRISKKSVTTPMVKPKEITAVVKKKVVEAPVEVNKISYKMHRVRSGENLFRIGLKYHVSALDIMAENHLAQPQDLKAGSVIKVPVVTKSETPTERTINERLARQGGFIWPVKGKIIERFGKQSDGIINNGIKIKVAESAPIHASESGTVLYADSGLKTYGNLILLRHKSGVITAYAHSSQNMVERGEKISKGQVIALAGMTGNATTPQLHFEVRRNARAINPLKVLSSQKGF